MGEGRIIVIRRLLLNALYIPRTTEIKQFLDGDKAGLFEIVVTHPKLPSVPEGEPIPLYKAQYERKLIDGDHYKPRFLGWSNESTGEHYACYCPRCCTALNSEVSEVT